MQAIFDMFDERVQEIDLYFAAIKELDQGATNHTTEAPYFNSEFIKSISMFTPAGKPSIIAVKHLP